MFVGNVWLTIAGDELVITSSSGAMVVLRLSDGLVLDAYQHRYGLTDVRVMPEVILIGDDSGGFLVFDRPLSAHLHARQL